MHILHRRMSSMVFLVCPEGNMARLLCEPVPALVPIANLVGMPLGCLSSKSGPARSCAPARAMCVTERAVGVVERQQHDGLPHARVVLDGRHRVIVALEGLAKVRRLEEEDDDLGPRLQHFDERVDGACGLVHVQPRLEVHA